MFVKMCESNKIPSGLQPLTYKLSQTEEKESGRELDDVVTHLSGGHSWVLEKLEHTFVTLPFPVKSLSDPCVAPPTILGGERRA